MSSEAQRVYLMNKMKNGEGTLAFPLSYPNLPFDIPENAPYGEFYIISGPTPVIVGGEGTGKVRVRYVGLVQLTVYVPSDQGSKLAMVAEDTFKDIFQFKLGRDAADSSYKFGVIEDFTPTTVAGWECYVFRVPFQRDTIESVQVSE